MQAPRNPKPTGPSERNTSRTPAPEFSAMKVASGSGIILAGEADDLQRHGYAIKPVRGHGTKDAFVAVDPKGNEWLFLRGNIKDYRRIADEHGLQTDGYDIDHTVAKVRTDKPILMASSLPAVNRSHGAGERNAPEPTPVEGVITTRSGDLRMARKLNGAQSEKPYSKRPIKEAFNGYAPNFEDNLPGNAALPQKDSYAARLRGARNEDTAPRRASPKEHPSQKRRP